MPSSALPSEFELRAALATVGDAYLHLAHHPALAPGASLEPATRESLALRLAAVWRHAESLSAILGQAQAEGVGAGPRQP